MNALCQSNNGTSILERNYKKLMELAPELWSLKIGDALKSYSEGYMDLNLDVLDKKNDQMTIALSHYYKHPGSDMIADPDMEIRVNRKDCKFIEALTYQDGYIYQDVYLDKNRYSPELKSQLNDFLSQWLKNCIDQGHCLKRSNFKK